MDVFENCMTSKNRTESEDKLFLISSEFNTQQTYPYDQVGLMKTIPFKYTYSVILTVMVYN